MPVVARVCTPSVVECLDATTTGCGGKDFLRKKEALESASLQGVFAGSYMTFTALSARSEYDFR